MGVSNKLVCQCGQFNMEVIGKSLLSAQCHCNSCRRAALELSNYSPARALTEDNGGTNYTLYRKDRVQFSAGLDGLHAYRLSPTAPTRRVLTSCCGTPVFVEFIGGHWLSIYTSMWPMSERERPTLRTQVTDAPQGTKFDSSIPAGKWTTVKFYARLAAAWAAMGFRTPKLNIPEWSSISPTLPAKGVSMRSTTSQPQ
jgi:hypothetical protein